MSEALVVGHDPGVDGSGGLSGGATDSRLGLRRLVAWVQRITHMAAKLGVAGRAWACSTAFSGIGCAEIAAMALTRRHSSLKFRFDCAVEKQAKTSKPSVMVTDKSTHRWFATPEQ